ncbi:unnamed protein product [Trichobilharzia regenti]|nr:unnamed protein product [Trichobilharzia regenti]
MCAWSCLLEFECKDDLQVVLDACQNKEIGGRPVKAVVGLHFSVRPNPTTNIDIKICKLPTTVGDDKIRGLFPSGSIVQYCSVPIDSLKRNVFVTLKNTKQNEVIIRELKKKGVDEHHLKIKRWSKNEKKSKNSKHKKLDDSEKSIEPVPDEMKKKSKKLKHKKLDDSEQSTEAVPVLKKKKPKKVKQEKMEICD